MARRTSLFIKSALNKRQADAVRRCRLAVYLRLARRYLHRILIATEGGPRPGTINQAQGSPLSPKPLRQFTV